MIWSFFRHWRERFLHDVARRSDILSLYNNLAGLMQIQASMSGKPLLKPMRGWAMSPDAMAVILTRLQEFAAPLVVEFGSGQSTVIFAASVRHKGGRLVSVDHDHAYSEEIRRQVFSCGLSDYVEYVLSPLREEVSTGIRSYDLSLMSAVQPDLILVDGPPYTEGDTTRLAPLRWAVTHCRPGGSVFLDDASRPYEKRSLQELQKDFPGLIVIPHSAEKGLAELRLPPAAA
jgi:predicted O-methyltransferase YrrM